MLTFLVLAVIAVAVFSLAGLAISAVVWLILLPIRLFFRLVFGAIGLVFGLIGSIFGVIFGIGGSLLGLIIGPVIGLIVVISVIDCRDCCAAGAPYPVCPAGAAGLGPLQAVRQPHSRLSLTIDVVFSLIL